MRVKDITGRNHNIKPENVQLHYEKARGLTYWYNNFKIRLALTDEQKNIIKQVVDTVCVFDGYSERLIPFKDLRYNIDN